MASIWVQRHVHAHPSPGTGERSGNRLVCENGPHKRKGLSWSPAEARDEKEIKNQNPPRIHKLASCDTAEGWSAFVRLSELWPPF